MPRMLAAAAALVLSCPGPAWGDGVRATPGGWEQAWNWDPFILFNLGLLVVVYAAGLWRLWRRAGAGRSIRYAQVGAYYAALVVLFGALISPLDALGNELSWAHMVQHVLLMMVAAPLIVLGSPLLVLTWALPRDTARWLYTTPLAADLLWRPIFVWTLYAATLWAWHLTVLYHAALRDPLVHDAEHLSFFLIACFYWRVVLDPIGRRRLHPLKATIYLFTTSLHALVLGIFMALAPRPWYTDYAGRTWAWGLTPLEDQQLAGLIMWVPAGFIYPAVAATLFGLWLARCPGAAATGETVGTRFDPSWTVNAR